MSIVTDRMPDTGTVRFIITASALAVAAGAAVAVEPVVAVAIIVIAVAVVAHWHDLSRLAVTGLAFLWIARPVLAGLGVGGGAVLEAGVAAAGALLLPLWVTRWIQSAGNTRDAKLGRAVLIGALLLLGAGFAAVVALGVAPVRLAVSAPLLLAPIGFAFMAAVASDRTARQLAVTVTVIGLLQLAFFAPQAALYGAGDGVAGTQLGSGAGAHIAGGGFFFIALYWFFVSNSSRRWLLVLAAVAVLVLTDTNQLIGLLPGLLIVGRLQRSRPGPSRAVGLIVTAGVAVAGLTYIMSLPLFANTIGFTLDTGGGKVAASSAVVADLNDAPATLLVGNGPAMTTSRAAYLAVPSRVNPDPPLAVAGLDPSELSLRYHAVAFSRGYVGDSSFVSPQSSLVGVVGDYGLIGVAGFVLSFGGLTALLWRRSSPWSTSALLGFVALVPLGLVADWLEQPAFAILLGCMAGLALRGPAEPATERRRR